MKRRIAGRIGVWAALAALTPGLAACGAGAADAGGGGAVQLSLVAYSTPQLAYEKIIKAYRATPEGKDVRFAKSFGASGDQSRAVESGRNADIVAFSLEPDMTRLVDAGIVDGGWNADESHGMVTESVVVIGARRGNPKGIENWDDLTRSGVQVITPNPFTSGGARWNLLAGYGAKSAVGDRPEAGFGYLKRLLRNVPALDDSARKSLRTFLGGKGDAILAYENEAIFARQRGQKLDYTVPHDTILIEHPVAVTRTSKHPEEAAAFLTFLRSKQAQQIFVDHGYRPTVAGVPGGDEFPEPAGLFTIKDLDGWPEVRKTIFDPEQGRVAGIARDLGIAVEK
ncbi:MAG: sulfate ABC transporter substrate-binding protein [Micromonosporaceae bacterium]